MFFPLDVHQLDSVIHRHISSVQSLSRVRLFATPWIAAHQASLSITISWSSLRLTSIESVMLSSHLILCRPLFSCPQSLPASESFPMSQLFTWGGQSTGASALSQGWSPSEWTGWVFLQSKSSFLDSFSMHVSKECWVAFPVLCLVIVYFIYSSVCIC